MRNFKTHFILFTTIENRGKQFYHFTNFFNYTNFFLTQVDTNTGASLMLQSGARWLGLSLDLIGSVIIIMIIIIIIIGQ